jgi:hypothetical protein
MTRRHQTVARRRDWYHARVDEAATGVERMALAMDYLRSMLKKTSAAERDRVAGLVADHLVRTADSIQRGLLP